MKNRRENLGVALVRGFGNSLSIGEKFKRMTAILISCEQATCAVPEAYREIFRGDEEVVMSPLGWEPGALNLAQGFAMKFRTPLVHGDVTRLLIDLEKDGEARWSSFSLKLAEPVRGKLVDRHERPYRLALNQRITEDLRRHDAVLHVMVHTDATTDGVVVLETPPGGALAEKIAAAWRARLVAAELNVRQVTGISPSALGAELVKNFQEEPYAQIRLGVSQTYFLEGRPRKWEAAKKLLLESLASTLTEVVA